MYDWQDRDGQGKILKILHKLTENGFNAKLSYGPATFVSLYNDKGDYICYAWASNWCNLGFIRVSRWCEEIGTTFSPDEAYNMMVRYFEEKGGWFS